MHTYFAERGLKTFGGYVCNQLDQENAVEIYRGDIYGTGYSGSKTIGVKQIVSGGKTNMVFVSAALNKFDKDYTKVDALFDQVLNKDFNW